MKSMRNNNMRCLQSKIVVSNLSVKEISDAYEPEPQSPVPSTQSPWSEYDITE